MVQQIFIDIQGQINNKNQDINCSALSGAREWERPKGKRGEGILRRFWNVAESFEVQNPSLQKTLLD
jgi:hypothetical protein